MLTWWESNWSMSGPCSGGDSVDVSMPWQSPGWPHLDSQLPANQCPPHTGLPEDVWGRDLLLPWDAEARWLARARPRERRRWGARTLGQTVTITTEGLRLTEGWQCTLYWAGPPSPPSHHQQQTTGTTLSHCPNTTLKTQMWGEGPEKCLTDMMELWWE